jgi:RHS repeat-associated protein
MVGGQVVSLQRYEYDVCERLVSVVDIDGDDRRVRRFSYDAESRLVEDFDPVAGQPVGSYRYDRKGNLVRDGARQVAVGPLDEPLQYGLRRIQYDALGHVRRTPAPAGPVECSFRANGFLTELRADGRVWRYEYDAFCRRVLKTDGITTWRFGWAGHQLLWEECEGYPGADVVRRDYLFIPETVAPLAFRENGRTYWLQGDARGAVIRAFDAHGVVVWSAEYDSFGQAKETVSQIRQPWRLLGQYHDLESGLHYNLARYYNPATKSYLSRDPLWFKPNATNYSYARNDPWNRADPYGTIAPLLIAGVVLGGAIVGAAVGAAVAAVTGGDPVAGAVEGGMTGLGMAIGGLVGAPFIGGTIGNVAGAFFGSAVEQKRKGSEVCWPCALKAAGIALAIDLSLMGLGAIPGVRRLAAVAGKRLLKYAEPAFHRIKGRLTSLVNRFRPRPSVESILKPNGRLIGDPGTSSRIRFVDGGDPAAKKMFNDLTRGGDLISKSPQHKTYRLGNGANITLRTKSSSGHTTIQIDGYPGLGIREIKFR